MFYVNRTECSGNWIRKAMESADEAEKKVALQKARADSPLALILAKQFLPRN